MVLSDEDHDLLLAKCSTVLRYRMCEGLTCGRIVSLVYHIVKTLCCHEKKRCVCARVRMVQSLVFLDVRVKILVMVLIM